MKMEFPQILNARILNIFIAASIIAFPATSLAAPWENSNPAIEAAGNGHGNKKYAPVKEDNERANGIMFDSYDQSVIKEYLSKEYKKNCPPGQAKKANGCLPPGQAKKYTIGQPLQVVWQNLPQDLLAMMGSVPDGYKYVMVDRDVLLISETTQKVIDSVTLLSALKK